MRHHRESKMVDVITLSLMFIVAVAVRLGLAWEMMH